MTLEEIKSSVRAGKTVHWSNENYTVVVDRLDQWFIICTANDAAWRLTSLIRMDEGEEYTVTLNDREEEFFTNE